jgi:type II secretory pathway component PulM
MSDSNTTVSLGCGSLILIAILFIIFGRSGSQKHLERDLDRLRTQVTQLQSSIDALAPHQPDQLTLSPEEFQQMLAKSAREAEEARVRQLLPQFRALYTKHLPEDPFTNKEPDTMDELLAPMNELIEGMPAKNP